MFREGLGGSSGKELEVFRGITKFQDLTDTVSVYCKVG